MTTNVLQIAKRQANMDVYDITSHAVEFKDPASAGLSILLFLDTGKNHKLNRHDHCR